MPKNLKPMSFIKRHGLGLALLALTVACLLGQMISGWYTHNDELLDAGFASLSLSVYLQSGHFLSSLFENWESEFLQMGLYVVMTAKLFQIGSAESRDFVSVPPRIEKGPTPRWANIGGGAQWIYENSLVLAFLALFAASFVLHAFHSWRAHVEEAIEKHQLLPTFWQHAGSSSFWFESFQNWQSEFLSIWALVMLTIVLRQKDSPQSKDPRAPHSQTGE